MLWLFSMVVVSNLVGVGVGGRGIFETRISAVKKITFVFEMAFLKLEF